LAGRRQRLAGAVLGENGSIGGRAALFQATVTSSNRVGCAQKRVPAAPLLWRPKPQLRSAFSR
jgi:hypothetical protein